jgi:hypothetical protein
MQRWEYLLVACVPHSMVMRPKYENGGLIRDWVEGNVADYCNDRGNEGWELVSAVNDPLSSRGEVIDLIFKRPVERGAPTGAVRPDFSPLSTQTD